MEEEKKKYVPPKIEQIRFETSFITTSYGDDGNTDDWGDEDAKPVQGF